MDVLDVNDDDEILECEECRFGPDLISMHNGKYLCSQCGRIYVYDTELGDIAKKKHRMQLRSEVDDVVAAESSEPMIVNFGDQYHDTHKTSHDDDNNKKSNYNKESIPEDKFLKRPDITILEEYTTYYDNVE